MVAVGAYLKKTTNKTKQKKNHGQTHIMDYILFASVIKTFFLQKTLTKKNSGIQDLDLDESYQRHLKIKK